ncbi:MAG: 23S rRNA (pseudouridine(1915)-N(3))-methyltransferase RlmH [Clostridia bacterium]|nr:23S rRNA (pseudouridine(1915)-N(3))-methyltransferase RlmH [Clostridia bacterium]
MLKINIVCVGKLKEKYLKDGINEYLKRISAYAKVAITEINEDKIPANPSKAQIEKSLQREGKEIIKVLANSYPIALCIEGESLSSEQFAKKLENIQLSQNSEISFVIGSSFGLSEEVKRKCLFKLSFSKMTFPHQLMRLVLCEQLYRVFQIINNGKYHK